MKRIIVDTNVFVGAAYNASSASRKILDALRQVDEVAYLRFASVYKGFQGASDFEREVAALEQEQ